MYGDVLDDVICVFCDQWIFGWFKIEWLISVDCVLVYVSKYIVKMELNMLVMLFFFFEYELKSVLDIVELVEQFIKCSIIGVVFF